MKTVKIKNARLEQFQNAPGKSILVDTKSHGTDDGELYQQSGIYSRPQDNIDGVVVDCNGNNIIIATHDYRLDISLEKGEMLVYSYDSDGVMKGKHKIDIDGNHIFNDGIKSAVSHALLNTALQTMVTAINANFATIATALSITLPPVTLDISSSEVSGVKLP